MKIKKTLGMTLLSIAVIPAIGVFTSGYYMYRYAMKPKPLKRRFRIKEYDFKLDDIDVLKLEITSKDNIKLKAYEVKNDLNTHKWVVVVHGYKCSASIMKNYITKFNFLGYNVLAPDLRGHGLSEGNYIGMGFQDRMDVLEWVDKIIKKDEKAEICLFGLSMGAATVMMVSGEECKQNIKVIIEDCGYTSADDEFSYQMKKRFNLPHFPFLNATYLITKARTGYSYKNASALECVKKSKIPTLFIHGTLDDFVPFDNLQKLYDAASCEKDIFIVEGAGHAECEEVAGDRYWNKVNNFINKYM